MARFGLIGGSYQSQSLNADAQRTVNWYPEVLESGDGRSQQVLYPTPGTKLFCTLPGPSVRGQFTFNGRLFAVAGTTFCEVMADGTYISRGTVRDDGQPAQMAANATQVMVCSGGGAYYLTLKDNSFQEIDTSSGNVLQGPVLMCGGADGYLIALLSGSQKIQISGLEDASTWSTLGVPNVDQVSVFPENVLSMILDHREAWLFGSKQTVVYYDSGSANIFDPVPGGYIEQGVIAPWSPVRLDNSVFWLGGDERGAGVAWRAQGYQPVRVSNHCVEHEWQSYPTMADAIGYPYQDQGHSFWMLRFPTANKTWCYDAATGQWHERMTLDTATGTENAHRSQCHAYIFGKHLVGDALSGAIYEMAIPSLDSSGNWQFQTDAGAPIHRLRRSPFISNEDEWVRHFQLQLLVEAGLGPTPPLYDGNGAARSPQLMVRWSNDGGHTWSNFNSVGFGKGGETQTRAIIRRLGRARSRVYEISCADPVPARIIDGYLLADPGYGPTERLSSQFRKVT